jgi:hypothetical protein
MSSPPVITIRQEGARPAYADPACVTLDASSFGLHLAQTGHLRLNVPRGWHAEPVGPLAWRVYPRAVQPGSTARFTVERVAGPVQGTAALVQTRLDLRNALDIAAVRLPLPNRASALGEVNPQRAIFEQTFLPQPELFKCLLFDGLYSDVVFLRLEAPRGGVCSGMAHWTIERARGREPDPPDTPHALERIAVYHGRQLTDRALLASLPWFLRGSSRAVFHAIRRDLLRTGQTDRAIDLDIPKLWRRDIARAVVAEGHVVVPYRLTQDAPHTGTIEVYDPNAPDAVGSDDPRTIHFDLRRNRYAYIHRVRFEDSNVGMIANRQRPYDRPGTAILALLGSLLFTPRRAWRSLRGVQPSTRMPGREPGH